MTPALYLAFFFGVTVGAALTWPGRQRSDR